MLKLTRLCGKMENKAKPSITLQETKESSLRKGYLFKREILHKFLNRFTDDDFPRIKRWIFELSKQRKYENEKKNYKGSRRFNNIFNCKILCTSKE